MRARATIVVLSLLVLSCSLFTSSLEGRSGPCAPGMAYVSDVDKPFCIDRWEASVVEIKGRDEVPHSPTTPVTDLKVKAITKPGVKPQGYISKNEAEAACKAARKRLCSGDEWQHACRGKKPTTYPYGDDHKEGYCNDSGRAPVMSLHPDLGENAYASATAMNDPRINEAPNTVANTGSYGKCKNSYNVFDMVGNLHEWTAEVSGSHGTFRGGYYQDTHNNGDGCKYKTGAHDVGYHDYSTGFRCCSDGR